MMVMVMVMVMVMQSGDGGGMVGKHNRMPTMSERSLAPDYTGTPHLLTDELQSMSTKLLALRELDAVMIERLRLFGYLCPQCLCLCLCSFRIPVKSMPSRKQTFFYVDACQCYNAFVCMPITYICFLPLLRVLCLVRLYVRSHLCTSRQSCLHVLQQMVIPSTPSGGASWPR